jgi:pSer/pThr/pTyr-binding forkhead associated (FHA) protein
VPFIEFEQRLFRLKEGDNVVGRDESATIRLPDELGDYRLNISVEGAVSYASSPNDSGRIVLNGRPLRSEPVALFHGDRFTLNGSSLAFIDDGGEATLMLDRPGSDLAPTVVEGERRAKMIDPEKLMRATPPEPESKVVAVLRRLDNNQAYIIDQSGFRIGREKRCDLIIPDRSVSRLHAEITCSRGQYLLRCLGRTSTRVNGKPIGEPHKLRPGDIVGIGNYEFAFSRRPLGAEEIVRAAEITPIRSAVPDAPTIGVGRQGGGRWLTWLIVIAGLALAAWMLLA